MELVKDEAGGTLSPQENEVLKLTGYGLQYWVPSTPEYVGQHTVYVKTTTGVNTHTFLRLKVKLIELCDTEEIHLINGDSLEKTFTMREPYGDSDLKVDLSNYVQGNRAGKGCFPATMKLVDDKEGTPISARTKDLLELNLSDLMYTVPQRDYAGVYDVFLETTTSNGRHTYLRLKLTIIELCDTEKINLL